MDGRQRQDLDRYITGNYGEDQFEGMACVDAGTSAHYDYCESLTGRVYDYDPTDNGPECAVSTRVLASHPHYRAGAEKAEIAESRVLNRASLLLYRMAFERLPVFMQDFVRSRIATWKAFRGVA